MKFVSKNYSRWLTSVRSASDADLSKAELADLDVLQRKQDKQLRCKVSIGEQRRADAYAKYFGAKPTDFASHNFAKWSEATKYLGKRFYDLLGEEKFEQETMDVMSFLTRNATASAPYISLSDWELKPKVVKEVSVLSAPNPSPEFIQRLVASLEMAWGKQSSGNGTTEWRWDTKEFVAWLKLEPNSAEGPYLALKLYGK